jgi:septal ring factor EnvC (AmiA/AmiB activator)
MNVTQQALENLQASLTEAQDNARYWERESEEKAVEVRRLTQQVEELNEQIEVAEDRLEEVEPALEDQEELRLRLTFLLGLPETLSYGDWPDIFRRVEQMVRWEKLSCSAETVVIRHTRKSRSAA